MTDRELIEQIKTDLRIDEGLRLEVYECTEGMRTIGYGHADPRLPDDAVWTLDHAEQTLSKDTKYAMMSAELLVGAVVWYRLGSHRKRALTNMAYQLGYRRLSGFKKMIQAVKNGQWQLAHDEALDSLWAKQTPNRARRVAAMLLEDD